MKIFAFWALLAIASNGMFLPNDGELSNDLKVRNETSTKDAEFTTRQKRYSHWLPWAKNEFTFSILRYTRDLPRRTQENVLGKAFEIWHKAAPQLKFDFEKDNPEADFKIEFVKGDHGDGRAFDGPGRLIAHVYPRESGKIHFDDDERFTDNSKSGTNLLSAAVHEIGHALGLRHSKRKTSVMYKLYRKYEGEDITLDSDDIKSIQELYRTHPLDRRYSNCKDKNRRICEVYRKNGYCKPNYEEILKEFCQFTCDLCKY